MVCESCMLVPSWTVDTWVGNSSQASLRSRRMFESQPSLFLKLRFTFWHFEIANLIKTWCLEAASGQAIVIIPQLIISPPSILQGLTMPTQECCFGKILSEQCHRLRPEAKYMMNLPWRVFSKRRSFAYTRPSAPLRCAAERHRRAKPLHALHLESGDSRLRTFSSD